MGFFLFILGGVIGFAIAWYLRKRHYEAELQERDRMVARLKSDLATARETPTLMQRLKTDAIVPDNDGEKVPAGSAAEPEAEPAAVEPAEPGDGPDTGPADDLTRINGIGPGIAKKLDGLGITTFRQIAAFSEDEIARVNGQLNFKGRIERDDWIGQAKSLIGD